MACFEKHYTAAELAELWGLSENTVRGWFRDEPGVLKFGNELLRGKKQNYVSLRIPESVADRVYQRNTAGDWRKKRESPRNQIVMR